MLTVYVDEDSPFWGLRPFNPKAALRDVVAGVTLASMNIPQVLGYARIAGMPVVTGLYDDERARRNV